MEEVDTMDFQSLRAKFQEDAALKLLMNKPAIPEKPKQVPSAGGRSSLLSYMNLAGEKKMLTVPRVVFKDEKKGIGKKCSETPPTSPKGNDGDKESSLRAEVLDLDQKKGGDIGQRDLKDKSKPTVLPVPPPEEKPNLGAGPLLFAKSPPSNWESPTLNLKKTLHFDDEFLESSKGSSLAVSRTSETAAVTTAKMFLEASGLENGMPTHERSDWPGFHFPKSDLPDAPEFAKAKPEGVSVVYKTAPCDKRVLRALEKSRKKFSPVQVPPLRDKNSDPQNDSNTVGMDKILPVPPPIDYQDLPKEDPIKTSHHSPPAHEMNGLPPEHEIAALKDLFHEHPESEMPQLKAPAHVESESEVSNLKVSEFPERWTPQFNTAEFQALGFERAEPEVIDQGISKPEEPSIEEHKQLPPETTGPVADMQSILGVQGQNESYVNYEDARNRKKSGKGQNTRKRNGILKNPYGDVQATAADGSRNSGHERKERKTSSDGPDERELKKKERQRLEKEKKKQKEMEKKENTLKKKFQVTGQEEPMYQARVTVASKGRKNDLAVKNGEVISIIRTTNCPKGKWLASSSDNKYGYIPVENLELDIKEMLELGKKAAKAAGHSGVNGETVSFGSRSSNHLRVSSGSFTDDSDEWEYDEEPTTPSGNGGPGDNLVPEIKRKSDLQQTQCDGKVQNIGAQHDALQKLATFFQNQRGTSDPERETFSVVRSHQPSIINAETEPVCLHEEEEDSFMGIIPPPDLYADMCHGSH